MIETSVDIFDVPAALGTVLQNREANSYQRTFIFRNLTASAITLTIQESADGGATWTTVGVAFTVGAAGLGSDVVVSNVASANILRVRGQNGGDDRDLQVTLLRAYLDANHIWTSPLV